MYQNYSLEGDLSPKNLKSELSKSATKEFINSFAGRKALLTLLNGYVPVMLNNYTDSNVPISNYEGDENKVNYLKQFQKEQSSSIVNLLEFVHDLLEIDYENVPSPFEEGAGKDKPLVASDVNLAFTSFWNRAINGKEQPKDAQARESLFKEDEEKEEGLWDKLKSKFNTFVDSWRGYTPEELQYSKSDIIFRKVLKEKLKDNPLSFSNHLGVKNMKVNGNTRNFSNDEACDMLAHKLTRDWFICEPECQPLIAEQLKAACVPAASFAPALKCNIFQYDGEADVSKSELAALDRVQQFVQDLKNEIAMGNNCGGIKMVPEAKAFAKKRELRKLVKNFDADEIMMGTPQPLIEADEAELDIAHPEDYEAFADKAEAGELPPEAMGMPAITAPTELDADDMGFAYGDVIDSTIADDSGIEQEDMSGYDPEPGELSLSAVEVGDAMAQAQADAIVWKDDEAPIASVATQEAMAAPQAFSRSLRRRQQSQATVSKNFANTRRPVQRTAQRPVQQSAQNMSGLARLLGDKYIR